MKQTRDNAIAPGGILGCLPVAEAVLVPFEGDAGMVEATLMQSDASQAMTVVILGDSVDGVLLKCGEAQIDQSIVVSDHIDVVDLIWGPVAVCPAPGDAVSHYWSVEKAEHQVRSLGLLDPLHLSTRDFSGVLAVPAWRPAEGSFVPTFPGENPEIGIVMEQPTNVFDADICFAFGSVHAQLQTVCLGYDSLCDSQQGLN